jgi:non-heme chloroperoxidase
LTDFRQDLPKIDVPILVIDGDTDRTRPYEKTAERLSGLINDMELVTIEGGPHAIAWTHTLQVNKALLQFIDAEARVAVD